jgi:hemolysin activation/secretion protein
MRFQLHIGIFPFIALGLSLPVAAQVPAPDAGRILQENQPSQPQPLAPLVDFSIESEPLSEGASGGPQVTLQAIEFNDNSVYSNAELLAVLGPVIGEQFDLAGIRALANRLTQHYRNAGYLFAQALIPAQRMADGKLVLQIVEGRYGQISTSGDPELAAAAESLLQGLESGAVIESSVLERQIFLLGDLPGIDVTSVMSAGSEVGTGDLDVRVSEAQRWAARVGADNHGNRYSGAYAATADLAFNRLLMAGDAIQLQARLTDEETWLGQLSYSLPLGGSGLRGTLSYAQTDYTLGEEFDGFTGTAKVSRVGVSYPLLRCSASNLMLSAAYQYKDLDDNGVLAFNKGASSKGLPLALQFDHRDGLLGGGVSYGVATLTPVQMKTHQSILGLPLLNEEYSFTKLNLQIARLQRLAAGFSLFGSLSGQYADRSEIDGSEAFLLGGPGGVRAYPAGEGPDARGWLGQLELRYAFDRYLSPYAFYDSGSSPNGDANERRSISGAGVGARYSRQGFSLDVSSAWKVNGGDARADDRQRDPRVWMSASYAF